MKMIPQIGLLLILALSRLSNALVCYNCTDCSAPGAQLAKINCDGQCFVGIDSENRVIQKCFEDPSGYQMYHTCDARDFCNINVFNQIKVIDNSTNFDNKSTSRDTLYYLLTTQQQASYDAVTTTTPETTSTTPSVATKQYYYIDMNAYTTTRGYGNYGCGGSGGYYTSQPVTCKTSSASGLSAFFFNKIYTIFVFGVFYLVTF